MSHTTRSLHAVLEDDLRAGQAGRAGADHDDAHVVGALPTTRSAFSSAASTTTAVPCWSSWKTGMSSDSFSRRSISKQRGAEMSSRLMPPNVGAIASTMRTISSTSVVSRQIGNASTPPSSLNSIALPSITGIAAFGPMFPSPSTAVPSETTATVLPLIVSVQADFRVLVDRRARRARRPACRPSRGRRGS